MKNNELLKKQKQTIVQPDSDKEIHEEPNPRLVKKELLFSKTPVLKALLKIAVPGIIGMFILSLYSITDILISIYFGTKPGYDSGAVRFTIQIANPIYTVALAFVFMIVVGATSRLSIYLGKKDEKSVYNLLGTSYTMIIMVLIAMIVFMSVLTPTLISSFSSNYTGKTRTIIEHQGTFFAWIMLWSLPFYAFSYLGSSMLRSEGSPYASSVIMILGCVFNVAGDFAFVAGAHMSVIGSAISTGLSWVIQFMVAFFFLSRNRKNSYFFDGFKHMKIKWAIVIIIFVVGSASFLRNIGMAINSLVINSLAQNLNQPSSGLSLLSVYTTAGQIIMIFMFPIFGLIQGAGSFLGYNVGKKDAYRVRAAVKYVFLIFISYLVIAEIIILALHNQLLFIFHGKMSAAESADYYKYGWTILWETFILFFLLAPQLTGMVFFQSMNMQKINLFIASLRFILVFIPVVFIFYAIALKEKNQALFWWYYPVTDIISSIISIPIILHWYRKIADGKHFPEHNNELKFVTKLQDKRSQKKSKNASVINTAK